MDLPGQDGPLHIRADGGTEAAVVLLQRFRSVAAAGSQVQGIPGRQGDAALPGGKAVPDAGTAVQQGGGQPEQFVLLMDLKRHDKFS